jgi:integrase
MKPITWQEFRSRYTEEALCFLAESTQFKVAGILDSIERIISPNKLRDLTAAAISRWAAQRRSEVADSTIRGNLAYIKAALKWAHSQGFLKVVPEIRLPKRAKGQKVMKGRPITGEEFERMLDAAGGEGVRETEAAGVPLRFFITGLWHSGLRLQEAMGLSWDSDSPDCISLDFSQDFPMFMIPANSEKAHQDRLLPMAPEFARMLQSVPESDRTGKVFKGIPESSEAVSKAITAIGKDANVVVNKKPLKYASAHDLRRSFGERWASRVTSAVLMQMMRHESIHTTMRYYVGRNAQAVAREIWAATPAVVF